jgi:hypothetical protein
MRVNPDNMATPIIRDIFFNFYHSSLLKEGSGRKAVF